MGSREIWKDIDDFTGYQISNKGRVRSFHKYKMGQNKEADALVETPHIMRTTSDNGCGYLKVMLRRNGKSYCRKIHRLVAKAFVSNPYDYDTVDHISNNKVDNRPENLQWIPRGENVSKAYRDGLHDSDIRGRFKQCTLVKTDTGEKKEFISVKDASEYLGMHYTSLSHAFNESYPVRGYYVEIGIRQSQKGGDANGLG